MFEFGFEIEEPKARTTGSADFLFFMGAAIALAAHRAVRRAS